jgi:hemolysin activation/secretion protein
VLRLDAATSRELSEGWRLGARAAGQWTRDALVAGEQFGIGGADSVRGFDTHEFAGDQGAYLSVDIGREQDWPDTRQGSETRFYGFVDAGFVHNRHGAPCLDTRGRCAAVSWGVGRRAVDASLLWQVDLAFPTLSTAQTEAGSPRLHLSLRYSF